MSHPYNEAFVTWDSNPAAPGGMEPDFQQTFEAGQAAERDRLLPLLRDCLGAIEEGRDDLIDRIERELGREG